MPSAITTGTLKTYAGEEIPFTAGLSDQVKAARECKIDASDMKASRVPLEYMVQMAYHALRREGKLVNVGFEAFLDTIADIDVDEDEEEGEHPESDGPPAE